MKIFKFLMVLFALSATSVAFTACDKEEEDSTLVGTWSCNYGEQSHVCTFGADGRFLESYRYLGEVMEAYSGRYTYSTGVITQYYDDGDVYSASATLSGDVLIWDGATYMRQ